MELNLSLAELEAILDAARNRDHERNKFAAALKGINIDANSGLPTGDDIRRRTEAGMAGMSEEQYDLSIIGIEIQSEE